MRQSQFTGKPRTIERKEELLRIILKDLRESPEFFPDPPTKAELIANINQLSSAELQENLAAFRDTPSWMLG